MPTVLQDVRATTPSGGNPTVTLSSTTPGTLLVAAIGGTDAAGDLGTSTSMPSGWIDSGAGLQINAHSLLQVWYYPDNPGGITSVAGTIASSGDTSGYMRIVEFSGVATSPTFDGVAGINNGTGAGNENPITTTKDGDLVISCAVAYGPNSAYGSDSGWTQYSAGIGGWGGPELFEWQVQTTHGTIEQGATASVVSTYENQVIFAIESSAVSNNADVSTTLTPSDSLAEQYVSQEPITTTLTPSTVITEDAVVTAFVNTTPSPSTVLAESVSHAEAISTTLVVSTAIADVRDTYGAISTSATTSTVLSELAIHSISLITTPSATSTFMEVSAFDVPTSTGTSPNTSLGTNEGRGEPISTVISIIHSMLAIFPRNIFTSIIPSSTLREAATHPNVATFSILSPNTQISATQPAAISTNISPSSTVAIVANRFKTLLTSVNPLTFLSRTAGRVQAIASSLTPSSVMALFRVQSAVIGTTLSPNTALGSFQSHYKGIQTLLQFPPNVNWPIITYLMSIKGKVAAISSDVSPDTSLLAVRAYTETITTSLTPDTSLTESATHIYNPMRTFVIPQTSFGTPVLSHSKAITTLLTPSTTMTGPAAHFEPLSTAGTVSTAMALSDITHYEAIKTQPLPSTMMSIQVARVALIRTQPQAWTYFNAQGVVTYTRTIPMKGFMGGPLLQWLLCGPRVVSAGVPRVTSCFGNVVGVA